MCPASLMTTCVRGPDCRQYPTTRPGCSLTACVSREVLSHSSPPCSEKYAHLLSCSQCSISSGFSASSRQPTQKYFHAAIPIDKAKHHNLSHAVTFQEKAEHILLVPHLWLPRNERTCSFTIGAAVLISLRQLCELFSDSMITLRPQMTIRKRFCSAPKLAEEQTCCVRLVSSAWKAATAPLLSALHMWRGEAAKPLLPGQSRLWIQASEVAGPSWASNAPTSAKPSPHAAQLHPAVLYLKLSGVTAEPVALSSF